MSQPTAKPEKSVTGRATAWEGRRTTALRRRVATMKPKAMLRMTTADNQIRDPQAPVTLNNQHECVKIDKAGFLGRQG